MLSSRHAEVLRQFYPELVATLPMDDSIFIATLYNRELLPSNLKASVSAQHTSKDKSAFFLDKGIKIDKDLEALVAVMVGSEYEGVKELAKQMRATLAMESSNCEDATRPVAQINKTTKTKTATSIFPQFKNKALKPTMKELRRHVIVDQYAVFWRDIAFELDLDCDVIDDIEENHHDCKDCFYHVLKIWLKSNVTWKALEIAIINGKNVKDELDPIDDLDERTAASIFPQSIHRAQKPTMKDINRYVKSQYAVFWKDIAFELDLEYTTIDDIENKFTFCETRLYEVVKAWLESNDDTTWKVLEMAIINAKRIKDGLDLIEDLVGDLPISAEVATAVVGPSDDKMDSYYITRQNDLETKVDRLRQDLCSIYKESGKIPDKSSWIVSNTAHVYMKSDDGPCILRLCSNESIHTMLSTDLTKAKHGNKPPKYILIEGISKMGKTFLAKKIAHCWANDKVLKDTKLLFFIYLGDPKLPKVKSGYDLIEYCISTMALSTIKAALPTVKAVMKFILDQHGKNVAFVFDALNEYPISIYKERLPQKNFITKVIRGNIDIFHESTIIITSQPVAKNALYNVVDRRIELLGVSNKEQKEYIKSTLDKLPLDKLPDEIKLENYYQYHPVIRGLCCVPCHLEAFVELLCRNCLPKTLAEMYSLFILCKPSKLKKIDDLPKRFTELAFEGLERFQFIFTVDQIQEAYPDIDDSLRAVLLQDYMHERVVFKLQIQEYLAAVYVSKLSETEREECIKNNIDQDRFKFMWIMYAAIQPEYFRYSIKQNAKKFSKKIDVNIFQCFMQTIGDEVCQMQTIEHKICQVDSSILSSCGFKSNESSWELENSKLNSIGMNSVLKYVIISKMSLNYANFSGNGLSPWGVYCAVIRHCVHESLTLCGDEGMKEYVNEIADSLRENEVLNSLTLFKIGSIGLESIKEVLYEEKGKLKEVYLSWKQVENARKNVLFYRKIFDKHGHKVDINVSYDGSIKNTLNLSSKSINDDGACLIAFGLHGNGMIRELDLSHNEITDIGAKAIIDFLKKNGTLQELNLSCNKISTIHDIVCNTSLRKLDISHNCISNCDTSLISNYSELEEINLSGNKIQFFEWNIHKTSNLRSVDFSENISSPWCVYYVIIRDCHFDRLTLYGCQGMEMYTKEIIGGLKISKLRSLTLCHTEKKIGYAKSVKKIVCRRNKIEIKGVLNFRGKTTDVNVSYNYDVKDSHKHHQYVDVSNQNLNDDIVLLITFGLYNNATVKQLDLSCSNIGDHGAVIISDCLKSEAVLCEVNLGLCLCKMNLSNNNINKMGAKGIAQALKGNRQLQELNLSGNKIQDEGAKEIAEALKDNSALQKLDISDNLISDDGVIIISNCLQSNTKSRLIQLNLLKNYNTIKGLHKILEVKKVLQKLCVSVVGMSQTGDEIPFSDNSTLHTLNVLEIDISPKYVAIIVDVVKQSRALRELSFRGTGISDSNVEIVNDCLRNSTLQVLEMPDNYISSEGMKKIVANIQNNGVLKKLDFSENYINDNGIKAVSNYLQSQSCKLQMLNLASNKITSTGARYIANAIEMNVTLQELDISYNDISDDGIEFISKRLRGLKELHISHINISDSGIRSIKDCLLNNCTLCVLDLSNNNITNDWVKIIAQSFQDNKTLKILDISKNKIDDEGIKYIRNHTLEKLNLSSNHITDIGVEMLARASWTGKLQVLDISENDIKKHEEIIACFKANTALQEIIL